MRKTDKKLDNQLIKVLTNVCENALKNIDGFLWLTHTVNYNRFPQSLIITLVFDTNKHLSEYLASVDKTFLFNEVILALKQMNINLSHPSKQIVYDTEENCAQQDAGNWASRLSGR